MRQQARREILAHLAASLYPKEMKQYCIDKELERRRALKFWKTHGLDAAVDAFSVSRPTLFRWKKLDTTGALAGSSTAPKNVRSRTVPPGLETEILRLRSEHPRLGKEKLQPPLAAWCRERSFPVFSESGVGRVLTCMKKAGRCQTQRRSGSTAGQETFWRSPGRR